jgi:hypothetical protein
MHMDIYVYKYIYIYIYININVPNMMAVCLEIAPPTAPEKTSETPYVGGVEG